MRTVVLLLSCAITITACHSVTDSTKKAINKTGQAIGTGASELVRGIASGVENSLNDSFFVSASLKDKGVTVGKFNVTNDTSSPNKNKLSLYMIFAKDFKGTVTAKVFDKDGQEYGRATATVAARHEDAKFVDFIFDNRTDLEGKSKFVME